MNDLNVVNLLSQRERYGIRTSPTVPFSSLRSLHRYRYRYRYSNHVNVNDLSIVSAWNPKRLNNMILAVGVGTPASVLLNANTGNANGNGNRNGNGNANANVYGASSNIRQRQDDDENDNNSSSSEMHEEDDDEEESESGSGSGSGSRSGSHSSQGRRRRTRDRDQSRGRSRTRNHGNNQEEKEDEDSSDDDDDDMGDNDSQNGEIKVNFTLGVEEAEDEHENENENEGEDIYFHSSDGGGGSISIPSSDEEGSSIVELAEGYHGHNHRYRDTMSHSAHYTTSIRHGGCINTATWMECPWRVSLTNASSGANANANAHAIESHECPTQFMTSGDDKLVKIWNCSGSMGTISPIPSGDITACPFAYYDSSTNNNNNHMNKPTSSHLIKEWTERYYHGNDRTTRTTGNDNTKTNSMMHGMVELLVTIRTGHRGNVFHVTPLKGKPGKILTCAADGYLLLSDIEVQSISTENVGVGGRSHHHERSSSHAHGHGHGPSSTTILGPGGPIGDDHGGYEYISHRRSQRLGMCFSHHMLDENTGLVCCESGGLRRFDLRLPSHSQPSYSLLGRTNTNHGENMNGGHLHGDDNMCKSCAIFSSSESDSSAYVFAGGSSDVGLYDLRFLTDTQQEHTNKVIQTYRPSSFPHHAEVSVSGIDISKDRKELLVSYENDQIYTFPIFPSCVTDPTVDEMTSFSKTVPMKPNHHFASYGGHLNRFTFLKSAKYAGPNDEYICTGSDSGHAFIYDKKTTSVVSLLKADKSTCNGIVPHPTLPIFITYGIGSSAKLWRATIPIDDDADDSIEGRRKAYHSREYIKSNVVSKWSDIQTNMLKEVRSSSQQEDDDIDDDDDSDDESQSILFPDELALRSFNINGHVFEGLPESFFRSLFANPFNPGSDVISNDLRSLPGVLLNNYYEACSAVQNDDDRPVRCSLNELHRRISIIRLYFQANQLGLVLDPKSPWLMTNVIKKEHTTNMRKEQQLQLQQEYQDNDVVEEVENISHVDTIADSPADYIPYDALFSDKPVTGGIAMNEEDYKDFYSLRYQDPPCTTTTVMKKDEDDDDDACRTLLYDPSKAWDTLHVKIKLLKAEGNRCIQNGSVSLAAYYYDKAIKYCAVVFMEYPHTTTGFIKDHQKQLSLNGGYAVQWTGLLKTLISTRLNLSMALLKVELSDSECACIQASLALKELKPFCVRKGVVMTGRKLRKVREGEPDETFLEAKELQAKAYFRLGSAKFKGGEYILAMRNFEHCLSAKKDINPDAKPDKVIIHRLEEARRLMKIKKERRRKKFKFAFEANNTDADKD